MKTRKYSVSIIAVQWLQSFSIPEYFFFIDNFEFSSVLFHCATLGMRYQKNLLLGRVVLRHKRHLCSERSSPRPRLRAPQCRRNRKM